MKALAAALVAAQAEMPAVEPDAVNPHYRSKYVTLDHLIAKTRPVLNRHGLAITQFPATHVETGMPVLRTTLIHGPSGEQIVADSPLLLTKNDMQSLGSALTYGRRYAWAAALGIAGDEDNDGEPPPPPSKPRSRVVSSPRSLPQAEQAVVDELEEKLDATPVEESPPMDDDLRGRLMRTFREKGFSERPQRHAFATFVLGRPIDSSAGLTRDEALKMIDVLKKRPANAPPPPPEFLDA